MRSLIIERIREKYFPFIFATFRRKSVYIRSRIERFDFNRNHENGKDETFARASLKIFWNDQRVIVAAAFAQDGKSSLGWPVNVTYELFNQETITIDRQSSPALVRRVFYFFIQPFVLYRFKIYFSVRKSAKREDRGVTGNARRVSSR